MVIVIFQDVQENRRTSQANVLIVSLASTEFENGSGVNECANTDNMSDVHCKFKRPGTRLTYGVRTLGVQLCGMLSQRY